MVFVKGHLVYKGAEKGWFTQEKRGKLPLSICEKISKKNKGKKRTEEQRKKMSESQRKSFLLHPERRKHIGDIQRGKKRPFPSLEARLNMSLCRRGEKHHSWKGGISKLVKRIRESLKYRLWRSDIFQRDNYTCNNCGEKGGKIEAHHIKSFSKILIENKIKTYEEAENCEELWNINNGITLCLRCHKKTENYGNKKSY